MCTYLVLHSDSLILRKVKGIEIDYLLFTHSLLLVFLFSRTSSVGTCKCTEFRINSHTGLSLFFLIRLGEFRVA